VRADGVSLFQTVQATWNLLETSAAAALADARAAGLGVIVKEVLANGRLTNRHAGPELREVQALAAALGTPVETLAVAAALAQPWADVVLSGAVTPGQLWGHLAALDVSASPPRAIAERPEAYWRRRAALAWT
jgi:aryl-alcohol dehydrogenase-like predicted oxidoreductase